MKRVAMKRDWLFIVPMATIALGAIALMTAALTI
jgi:hypothetical protein